MISQPTPLRRLWWLNPTWVFGMGTIGTFFLALYLSNKSYDLYETPKYLKFEHVWIALSAWLALEVGRRIGSSWQQNRGNTGEAIVDDVNWWFFASFGLTVAAYSLLLLRGLQNGLSLAVIKENLLAPPEEVSRELAGEVVVYLPGVTTATQFGIICVLLGVWLHYQGRTYVRKYMAVIVGLAALRALLFHERLALIEVVLPAAVLVLRLSWLARPLSPSTKLLFRVGPIVALMGMVTMFGVFEYFRSWRHYRNEFTSISEFTVWRLGGYYSTSVNNGALGWEREGQRPLPFATINAVWEFPLVEKSPFSYVALTGHDPPKAHEAMLKQYGNYEYNSLGGLFEPLRDYGLPGSLVWWLAFGAVLGWAYRGFLEGSLLGLLLFPIAFVSLLEMPRFIYLTHPRALAALVVIGWLGWRIYRQATRARAAGLAGRFNGCFILSAASGRLTMLPCVNGRYLVQRLTGIQRYAQEIVSRWEPVPIHKPAGAGKGVSGHLWEQLRLPTLAHGPLWSPSTTGPLAVKRQVVTIHDTAFLDHADCFSRTFAAWYQWLVPRLARRVRRIITVSQFSKQRIIEVCRVPEEKVEVILSGVGPQFQPQPFDMIERARRELKLPARYVLCVCSLEPRKNLRRLLAAWTEMPHRPANLHLVLAGAKGNVFHDLEMDSAPANVQLVGYVGDDLLPALYAGAEFMAFPSLYEGFGLPVLEAMASGTPVLCSSTTSLPEVAGDAALLVDPLQIESIAAGLQQLADDGALRVSLRERGLQRAKTFRWEQAARQTWDVLAAVN